MAIERAQLAAHVPYNTANTLENRGYGKLLSWWMSYEHITRQFINCLPKIYRLFWHSIS
jgi:hypothetical protein